jgi:hypothetical protein
MSRIPNIQNLKSFSLTIEATLVDTKSAPAASESAGVAKTYKKIVGGQKH